MEVDINITSLKKETTRKAFNLELKNRFSVLDNTRDEEANIQDEWNNIKNVFTETAEKVL